MQTAVPVLVDLNKVLLFQVPPRPYTWLCLVTLRGCGDRGCLVFKANKPYMREGLGLFLFGLL